MKEYLIWRIGCHFIVWADSYFWRNREDHRFNHIEDLELAFYSYRQHLNIRDYRSMTLNRFLRKLRLWCKVRGYTINPYSIMENRTEQEQDFDEIHYKRSIGRKEIDRTGIYIENIKAPQRYDCFG